MDLSVFLAVQVSILPIQLIMWWGLYTERQRMQRMLRFALIRLSNSRR